jgi:D-serine deaminase-like pyridoxal phosphate-dependent protein
MNWPEIDFKSLDSIASPGLLVDANRVDTNVQAMIAIVNGQASRLRPHVKTHKMPDVVRIEIAAGISKFKAATIAEAEMVAAAGGKDVFLSYPVVGPNLKRLADLIDRHPDTSFAAMADNIGVAEMLAENVGNSDRPLRLFIDVDCGMHRTGIPLGSEMDRLRQRIESLPGVTYAGLHVYDGHLHSPSMEERKLAAGRIITEIRDYDRANPSPTIIGGGSPTFGVWSGETNWECSPGTTVFWDVGYGSSYPDLGFSMAIALLTRVISKPGGNRICLDIGYKSVASEMPLDRRVVLPGIDDATFIGHSEEHLVLETAQAASISHGQPFLAFPRHICPTVALHARATVVRDGCATSETWPVTARDR